MIAILSAAFAAASWVALWLARLERIRLEKVCDRFVETMKMEQAGHAAFLRDLKTEINARPRWARGDEFRIAN